MRQIVSPLSGILSPLGQLRSSVSIYAILNFEPAFVTDFGAEFYRKSGATSTFSDSITHSASSNATMVDSDGLLKWRPHNLLSYSEQFDDAAWVKTDSTVTANAAVAPDGTTTADFLIASATTSEHSVYQSYTSRNYQVTVAVYAKANGYDWLQIKSGFSVEYANFNLSSGTRGTVTESSSSSITPVGNGWHLCEFTTDFVSSTQAVNFVVSNGDLGRGASFLGDGTSGIYIWGAHAYRSDLGGMADVPASERVLADATTYVPTTTSAVYLPRRGHHVYNGDSWVNKGLLHESEQRVNLVTYSNDFTDASWVKTEATVTGNETAGPDGVSGSGSKLVATTSANVHYTYVDRARPAGVESFSIYVKSAGYDYAVICAGSIGSLDYYTSVIDLSNGDVTATYTLGTHSKSTTVESVGNGFYRVSISGDAEKFYVVGVSDTATYSPAAYGYKSFAGDGTSGIYIYGAQVEAGSTPSSYIPTSGATVTRSAETLTVPAANLPWPSPVVIGEELVTNGTFDTDEADTTGWDSSSTLPSTGSTSDGEFVVTTAVPNGRHLQAISCEIGKVYLVSGYARVLSGSGSAIINMSNNNSGFSEKGGAQTTETTPTLLSFVFTASQTTHYVGAGISANGTGVRVFDNISVKEINPLSVSIQMPGEATGGSYTPLRWYKDANNYITQNIGTSDFTFTQANAGVVDSVTGGSFTSGVNSAFNFASRHGSTFINGAVDGTALTADLTPTALPDLSATDLQLGFDYMGTISLFRIWADDLTDAGIAEASAPSTVPSLSLTFDGASTSFTDSGMVV